MIFFLDVAGLWLTLIGKLSGDQVVALWLGMMGIWVGHKVVRDKPWKAGSSKGMMDE
jgi:hypothetical protein